jgi:hypothetical protein
MRRRFARPKGISFVQWAVIVVAIAMGVFTTVSFIGTGANTKLNETASDMSNVSNLPSRFGKQGGS